MRRTVFLVTILAALAPAIAAPVRPVTEKSGGFQALAVLQPGQWELRPRTGTAEKKSMCLNDMRTLFQMQHANAQCTRYTISDDPRSTTVHYSCARAGHGRTTIKVETPRLIQLETQGIVENAPFAFAMEGRRTGACATPQGNASGMR